MLTPYMTRLMADARIADLRASAARHRSAISDDPWSEANGRDHDGETIIRRPSWRRRLLNLANPRARGATPSAAMRGAASQSNR
jgi:hypothetical protein